MQKTSHQLLTVVEAAARTGRKVSTWRRDILLRRSRTSRSDGGC